MIAGWGPEDPRTVQEVETLLDQRFGPAVSAPAEPAAATGVGGIPGSASIPGSAGIAGPAASTGSVTAASSAEKVGPADRAQPMDSASSADSAVSAVNSESVSAGGTGLRMSSAEFTALLNLTPQQRAVLGTLVRQTNITIVAG
jgi:hypothetical protein